MQRRDAIVAGAGAVIVLLAVVGAAVQLPDQTDFAVKFATREVVAGEGTTPHTAENVRERHAFTVEEANASRLVVTVRVSFVAGPGAQAAMSVLLTAPNGTTYEVPGTTQGPAVGGTQAVATAEIDVPLAPLPANATVRAASPEEAAAQAAPAANASWVGEWTLDVSAQAGPTPLPRATTEWRASFHAWTATATADPALSK